MKKVIISLTLAAAAFAASDCAKIEAKLDAQISKLKAAKHVNEAKIEYLSKEKAQIKAACENGKIDTLKLQKIKTEAKYDYDKAQLEAKQTKLNAQKEAIESKHKAELEKLNAKREKAAQKLSDKEHKAKKAANKAQKHAKDDVVKAASENSAK